MRDDLFKFIFILIFSLQLLAVFVSSVFYNVNTSKTLIYTTSILIVLILKNKNISI